MQRRSLAPLLLLGLAGCAAPLQDCIDAASRDLRAVTAARAEAEANVARGYAVHVQTVRQSPVTLCTTLGQSSGGLGIYASACSDPYRRIETPVAIDLDAEREKLAALREEELALRAEAQREVNRCYAAAEAPA